VQFEIKGGDGRNREAIAQIKKEYSLDKITLFFFIISRNTK
jgi:hypothetical protein